MSLLSLCVVMKIIINLHDLDKIITYHYSLLLINETNKIKCVTEFREILFKN